MGIVVISIIRYGDPVTTLEMVGYLISLCGFATYQYEKLYGKKAKPLRIHSQPDMKDLVAQTFSQDGGLRDKV